MKDIAISLKDVTHKYRIKFNFPDRTEEREVTGVNNINLVVKTGETVAVLGPNGSGKTTLLKIIAGLISADNGEVKINGKVRGIFELGAGLIPDATGFQNIEMLLKLYGEYFPDKIYKIIEFSELGDFIYAPVRTYSQGMYLRLAFSVAINTEPDILVVDDILAVGDVHFQKKCLAKIREIINKEKTVLIVTHNFDLAQALCSRGLFMEKGKIVGDGPIHHMRPFFDSITGNIGGIGIVKNEKICFIFNNGRGSIIYNNNIITPDLGLFFIYTQDGKVLYSVDLAWQVKERKYSLVAEGKFGEKIISRCIFSLEGNHLKLFVESLIPELRFNIMLQSAYSTIKYDEQLIKLPDVNEVQKREWDKVLESVCDNMVLTSHCQDLPSLLMLFSPTNVSIYNYNFYEKVRIFQTSQQNMSFNLIIEFLNDLIEKDTPIVTINPLKNWLTTHQNNFFARIFHDVQFISYKKGEFLQELKYEVINASASQFIEIIKSERDNYSMIFTSNIQGESIRFNVYSPQVTDKIDGIDFYLYCYDIYCDNLGERQITDKEFQNVGEVEKFILQSSREEVCDLNVNISPAATLLVRKENNFSVLRFLFKINLEGQTLIFKL